MWSVNSIICQLQIISLHFSFYISIAGPICLLLQRLDQHQRPLKHWGFRRFWLRWLLTRKKQHVFQWKFVTLCKNKLSRLAASPSLLILARERSGKASETFADKSFFGGLPSPYGWISRGSFQVLQTHTFETVEILPHQSGMISRLHHLPLRSDPTLNSCSATGAFIIPAVDDVTRPRSEWRINNCKIGLLYQPDAVHYQSKCRAGRLSGNIHQKTFLSAILWDAAINLRIWAQHTSRHHPACIHILWQYLEK